MENLERYCLFYFSLLVRIASVVGGSCTEVTLLLWHQLNEEEEAAVDQELVDGGSKVRLEGRDCIDMKKGGGQGPK